MKSQPIHEVRIGTIKAAIWRSETEAGTRHNVTFSRIYREDDRWHSSESFGINDLLVLAKIANIAHSWLFSKSEDGLDLHENPRSQEAARQRVQPRIQPAHTNGKA